MTHIHIISKGERDPTTGDRPVHPTDSSHHGFRESARRMMRLRDGSLVLSFCRAAVR